MLVQQKCHQTLVTHFVCLVSLEIGDVRRLQMRARSVVGSVVPAWAVPAPRLHMETSQPAVHALGRRRALPRSARPHIPLVIDAAREGNCIFGRNRRRRTSTSLHAGARVGEEGRCDEAPPRKHDDDTADATTHQPARAATAEDVVHSRDERVEKKGRARHRLSPMQVQQQALIRRLRTLETRRDWRGVLAAMVRNVKDVDTCCTCVHRFD